MEKEVKEIIDTEKYYLSEFDYFNGECYITFNILDISFKRMTIKVAITDCGKIYITDYILLQDKNGDLYFEYGCTFEKIYIKNFEIIDKE